MRFAFVHVEKANHKISPLCRVLGVSRQGYHAWVNRGPSLRSQSDAKLAEDVERIHQEAHGTYGSPRIHAALRREGIRVSKRRVERAMRKKSLKANRRKRFRVTTTRNEADRVAPNDLNRRFTVERPNQVWVTDITYIQTACGWAYLAAILDLYSRQVVGWAVGNTLSTQLALNALEMALVHRQPEPGLLHHSDRGCQYTSARYRGVLKRAGIVASMSRKGNCWDNAVAESFFATLKGELTRNHRWRNHQELTSALFEYIEVFYNRKRLHSTLDYNSPAEFEAEYYAALAAK